MGLLGKLKAKVTGKAVDVGGAMVARQVDAALESGEYGEASMRWWERFKAFMNGKKTLTGALLLALPKAAAAASAALLSAGYDPLEVARWTAWGGGAVLATLGLVHKVVKWLDDLTPDDRNDLMTGLRVLLVCLGGAAFSTACASAQMRLGREPRPLGPDPEVVEQLVCTGQADEAARYVELRGGSQADRIELVERARKAVSKRPGCCAAEGKCEQ